MTTRPPSPPLVFVKFPSSVIGPTDAIHLPTLTTRADLGGGAGDRDRPAHAACRRRGCVGLRFWLHGCQRHLGPRRAVCGRPMGTRQEFRHVLSLGPVVLTADEVDDPQALALCARLNGEVVQES